MGGGRVESVFCLGLVFFRDLCFFFKFYLMEKTNLVLRTCM